MAIPPLALVLGGFWYARSSDGGSIDVGATVATTVGYVLTAVVVGGCPRGGSTSASRARTPCRTWAPSPCSAPSTRCCSSRSGWSSGTPPAAGANALPGNRPPGHPNRTGNPRHRRRGSHLPRVVRRRANSPLPAASTRRRQASRGTPRVSRLPRANRPRRATPSGASQQAELGRGSRQAARSHGAVSHRTVSAAISPRANPRRSAIAGPTPTGPVPTRPTPKGQSQRDQRGNRQPTGQGGAGQPAGHVTPGNPGVGETPTGRAANGATGINARGRRRTSRPRIRESPSGHPNGRGPSARPTDGTASRRPRRPEKTSRKTPRPETWPTPTRLRRATLTGTGRRMAHRATRAGRSRGVTSR